MTQHHLECLERFKVLLLDADGVWFDGGEYRSVGADGSVTIAKRRDHQDGQGLSFLRGCGILVKFVSGEGEPLASIVNKLNNLPSVKDGSWAPVEVSLGKNAKGGKVDIIDSWLSEHGFEWSDCVYIGDDINDYHAMKKVSETGGLAVAPSNATRKILAIADLALARAGGNGAVREFAELVLDARSIDETTLPPA